jgi:hypothetical protein
MAHLDHDVQVGNDGFGAEPQDGGEEMHQRECVHFLLTSLIGRKCIVCCIALLEKKFTGHCTR